ncbi:allene oxide cyclase barrel-like domain-containing protein [Nocardia coubleae]|uniref:Dirigent protein n=1 Tax=Nocardia coubleae TaxID=356147 RepID=A0A846VZB4_9NOCA|nr:hypothetical protein [Nocardia coubleae]NKX85886.1 dirigent protein [Nocardia coubleae]
MPFSENRFGKAGQCLVAMTLIGAVAGGCGTAETETADPPGQVEVLELRVQNIRYEAIDLGPAGPSLGDMDVYSGDAIQDGRAVGHGGGTCQTLRIDGGNATMQCSITMELGNGSITMQSLWRRGTSPLDMAISGGTGDYREARGTVRFWDIATPNERARAEIIR